MTVRADITVDWDISPRIIRIAEPSQELTLQDLLDTCRDLEDEWRGQSEPKLIDAAGKSTISAGKLTGITATLNNAQIQFAGRLTPNGTGTASGGSTGLILIDSLATFVTNGIVRGTFVVNFDDQSVGSVRNIVSETEIRTFSLGGGITNQFSPGDAYGLFVVEQMDILDGNLLAVDENDIPISPVLPSFATQIVRTGDVSAVIVETGVSGLTTAEAAALARLDALSQSDDFYDKSTGLLHMYFRGTTTDIIPPKLVVGSVVPDDVLIAE